MARFLVNKPLGMYRHGSDPLDGDFMNLLFCDPSLPALKFRTPRTNLGGGALVSAKNMPTKLVLTGRKRKLMDIDNALNMFLASARFVDLVRKFQPDIQTFPVECSWSDGTPAGQCFFLFKPVMLDAVNREKTTARWTPTVPGQGIWYIEGPGQKFVFDKSRMGDTHFWLAPNMPSYGALVSETLYKALRDADMQSFAATLHFEEI